MRRAKPTADSRRKPRYAILAVAGSLIAVAAADLHVRSTGPLCRGCNVVVISVDTLRADHVGAYGYARDTTPNIDALARRSVLFEDAISQSSWTRPAHASMLTGLYPSEHGITAIRDGRALAPDVETLAGVLGSAGYRTAAFTGGGNMSAHFGFDRGFAVYDEQNRRLADHAGPLGTWLDAAPGEPFFVLLHGYDAHKPYRARPRDRRALGLRDRPQRPLERACRHGGDEQDRQALTDGYDAAVHRADAGVGKLVAVLAERGVLERTVVIVTADHGEELFDHGGCFHVRTLHREILHVPLIIGLPRTSARRVSGVVPASVSLGATVLDVVGAPAALPGPSLARAVRGDAPAFEQVVSETETRATVVARSGPVRSLTSDREKVVTWLASGRVEYFDLLRDRSEQFPRVGDVRAGPLLALLDSWASSRLDAAVRPPAPMPTELARRLDALGYTN